MWRKVTLSVPRNHFRAFPNVSVHFFPKTCLFPFCFSLFFYPPITPWFDSIRFASPRLRNFLIWRFRFTLCFSLCFWAEQIPYLGIEFLLSSPYLSATPDRHDNHFEGSIFTYFPVFLCVQSETFPCHLDQWQPTLLWARRTLILFLSRRLFTALLPTGAHLVNNTEFPANTLKTCYEELNTYGIFTAFTASVAIGYRCISLTWGKLRV